MGTENSEESVEILGRAVREDPPRRRHLEEDLKAERRIHAVA